MTSFSDISKHTPMMQQWATIKQSHPNALLLFRMGDFYELFFEDAQRISKLLDVTLTHRGESGGERVPMAGVPHHAIEQYIARLVRLNQTCVIAEQYGEPGGKTIMTRKVTRVITPGTVTESEWIGDKDDSIVCAIAKTNDLWALGWVNLSSGQFKVIGNIQSIKDAVQRVGANEILTDASVATTEFLNDTRVITMESSTFTTEYGVRQLRQCFDGIQPEAVGLKNEQDPLLCVIGALLRHIQNTQGNIPSHLSFPSREDLHKYVVLDSASRKNLELVQNLQGTVTRSLWNTLDDCYTTSGSRMLKRWICYPERSQYEASLRHDAVRELGELPDTSWISALQYCGDTERVVARVGLQTAKPKDLVVLRNAIAQLPTLQAGLAGCESERLQSIHRTFDGSEAVLKLLQTWLLEDPRSNIKDGGVIAPGVDTELDECKELLLNADGVLKNMEEKERAATGINNLKIQYNRNSGYTIEVSNGQVDKVPVHYQRKQTLKNLERYTTAELREFENKALTAQDRSLKREKYLYESLLGMLQKHVPWLSAMTHGISQLDILANFSRQAKQWNYSAPVFSSTPGLSIQEGRHPVVERYTANYQSNSLCFDEQHRSYIITGPNMGGKSTFMRQTALMVILAYIGSFVPAKMFKVGPVDAVCTRIGASDDVASGRSTFMVEMEEAAGIVEQATDKTIAILDELGRGTSSIEGRALAQALLERLHRRNRSMVLFATHYREVAQSLESMPGVHLLQAAIEEKPGVINFLHQMKEGIADKSYGIHVAMMAGIPDDVIVRAQDLVNAHQSDTMNQAQPANSLDIHQFNLDEMSPKELWLAIANLQKGTP